MSPRGRQAFWYSRSYLENASSGLTICAEAAALTLANSAGDFEIEAIAVVGFNIIDSGGASRVVAPCGSCRQLIAEAAQLASSDVRVLCCNGELSNILVSSIGELLPQSFGPENLALRQDWTGLRSQLQRRIERLVALRRNNSQGHPPGSGD